MINLLPLLTQKGVRKIYLIRRRIAYLLAVCALLLTTLVLLVPAFLLISVRAGDAKELIGLAETQPVAVISNKDKEETKRINTLSSQLVDAGDFNPKVSRILKRIIELKGEGISIIRIKYGGSGDMTIRGMARSRNDLLQLVAILENQGEFTNVDSPVSNLINNVDIDFIVQLKLAK